MFLQINALKIRKIWLVDPDQKDQKCILKIIFAEAEKIYGFKELNQIYSKFEYSDTK